MVRPRVTRTAPTRIWWPPPVKRPRPTLTQSVGIVTTVDADCPPSAPSPQLATATAVTVTCSPGGAGAEPENEYSGAWYAPVPTTKPLKRMSICALSPSGDSKTHDVEVNWISTAPLVESHTADAVILG